MPSAMKKSRTLPRPFELHWGSGRIVEEASYGGPHHEPAIQLLEFDEGDAAGTYNIRFCYYDHAGHFQRGPLIIDDESLRGIRRSLRNAPKLRALLRKLAG